MTERRYKISEEESIYEDDPETDILIELSDYADENPNFDASFIDSVRNMFDKYGYMSAKQYNCLVKLYYKLELDTE